MTENGIYRTTFPTFGIIFHSILSPKKKGKKAVFAAAGLRPSKVKVRDLNFLSEIFQNGKIKTVIYRQYPLEDITEAHQYVKKGHKKGNVIISIAH